jgi:hypothetical protein
VDATACPSDFSLDDLELHGPAGATHLAGCARCADRRARRAVLEAEFRGPMADQVWAAVRRAGPGRARGHRRALLGGVAAACLAALVVVGLRRAPERAYTGVKGGVGLEVVCRRDGRLFHLEAGQPVQRGDQLRFRPLGVPPGARHLVLGSVDGSGRFAPFYPADVSRESVPLPAAGEPLPGAVTLDDAGGPERLLLVVSPAPLAAAAVAAVAERAAATGEVPSSIAGVPVAGRWLVFPRPARTGR